MHNIAERSFATSRGNLVHQHLGYAGWPSMSYSDDQEIDHENGEYHPIQSGAEKVRMWDWVQAFSLPLEMLGCLVFVPFLTAIGLHVFQAPILAVQIVAPVLFVGFAAGLVGSIWAQFGGILFDGPGDSLTFPTYSIRRSIRLSEIRDGNCEYASGGSIFGRLVKAVADGFSSGRKVKSRGLYVVNLAGDFGSRQVRFYTKKRRDQFLSVLRYFVPDCRITRWPGWS